jgi:hypothetical protein
LELGQDPVETFMGLPFPLIVECKDHDDNLGNVVRNVEAGWTRVQEKLSRQATEGWIGTYQPWKRARGYLYCISAVLPHQQAREELGASISGFFSALSASQKPSIEQSRVLDWSDLHPLFNELPRLCDAWLGVGLEGLVGHNDYEAGLTGFREYLRQDKLPYLYPSLANLTHPEKILADLTQEAGSGGIMIVGAGGVGKTRVCFEVAKLANQQGWRVLHVIPGEPAVTTAELGDIVLRGNTRILLVFDYLDQIGGIDWGTVRHRLMPNAKLRSLHLALLANARPGILQHRNKDRDSLFRKVDLVLTDQREQIAAHMQATLAPKASAILGMTRVLELCGNRPIIGMFIARELERYAGAGTLDETVASRLRGGDLQGWIRKRFQEDRLLPEGTEELLPPTPRPVMTAAAAALSASPLRSNELVTVIEMTLAACGEPEAVENAPLLLSSLFRSGWIEPRGIELDAPHNVVADELLELTLCDRDWQTVRPGQEEKVLVSALHSPRVMGRFSVSLDRVLGQPEFPEALGERFRETVSRWLVRHADTIGRKLTTSDPDEVSYALGAVVTGVALGSATLNNWDALVAPWLLQSSRKREARHLLYRGLKHLPAGKSDQLIDIALGWLNAHPALLEATFVLAPLLARHDLGDRAQDAVTAALVWLAENPTAIEAKFFFNRLLARQDLGDRAQDVITATLRWLTENPTVLEARFVLQPLLARQDLGERAQDAVTAALRWLEENPTVFEAGFVLQFLLARQDLEERAQDAVTAAFGWLAENPTVLQAGYVLPPLLARQDLGERGKDAVKAALRWLTENPTVLQAGYVLPPLLARKKYIQEVVTAALRWLERHFETQDAEFVLGKMLGSNLLSKVQRVPCIRLAIYRINKAISTPEVSFLLKYILKEKYLSDTDKEQALTLALEWLRRHSSEREIDFVFKKLLRNSKIEDSVWREVSDYAFAWLRRTTLADDRDHTLNSLMTRTRLLTLEEKNFLRDDAIRWLDAFPDSRNEDRLETNLKWLADKL